MSGNGWGRPVSGTAPEPEKASWGHLSTGEEVFLYTLRGAAGVTAMVSPFGAALVSLIVPDREGRPGEMVLGLETPSEYEANPNYLGATVGRFAGRIARGRFALNGRAVELPLNFAGHHLHGGPAGFSHRLWSAESLVQDGAPAVRFTLASPNGDQGYPGAVSVAVTYTLDASGTLAIRYEATADGPTHLNLTNHAYFNLAGGGEVTDHRLRLTASRYLEVTEALIPTGSLLPVAGTPFDFRKEKRLFRDAHGYDHCFALDGWDGSLRTCAEVRDPESGRVMTVRTTMPGLQLYTPDFREPIPGRAGASYRGRAALCLEAQFFPDTPNHPAFPSTRLDPGGEWRQETSLVFRVE